MSCHEIPSWAVVEALRAAQARKERSIAARVRAWRERLREARSAARDAAVSSGQLSFGDRVGERSQREGREVNPGEERVAGPRTIYTRGSAKEREQ